MFFLPLLANLVALALTAPKTTAHPIDVPGGLDLAKRNPELGGGAGGPGTGTGNWLSVSRTRGPPSAIARWGGGNHRPPSPSSVAPPPPPPATATATAGDSTADTGSGDISTATASAAGSGDSAPPPSESSTSDDSPSTSSSSSSGNGGGGGGGGGGGVGVGWDVNRNSASLSSYESSGLNWYYTWSVTPLAGSSAEFVPMVHGAASVDGVAAAEASWPSGVKYVLGFNEPDMVAGVGGSDIAAGEAATLHQQWVGSLSGSYSIGSPAVARGSKSWFDDWNTACAGACVYDFIPFHFYGNSVDQLKGEAELYRSLGKPLWLTEWNCEGCSDSAAADFMQGAIEWFRGDGSDLVSRWAWFGAFSDMAGTAKAICGADGSVSDFGVQYLGM